MKTLGDRVEVAFWKGVLAFFIGCIASCGVFTYSVRNLTTVKPGWVPRSADSMPVY